MLGRCHGCLLSHVLKVEGSCALVLRPTVLREVMETAGLSSSSRSGSHGVLTFLRHEAAKLPRTGKALLVLPSGSISRLEDALLALLAALSLRCPCAFKGRPRSCRPLGSVPPLALNSSFE